MRFLALILLLVSAVGCVTKHAGIPKDDIVIWQVGRTTQRDVVARWGNPDRIQESVWVWKDWNLLGGKFKASYMMVGFTLSNSRVSTREQRLTFDARGVLTSVETVDSVPAGIEWSANPFF